MLSRAREERQVGPVIPSIGACREDHASILNPLNNGVRDGRIERGATPAAPDAPTAFCPKRLAHIGGWMHHDVSFLSAVVHAGFEAEELQGISMLSGVGVSGQEGAEA